MAGRRGMPPHVIHDVPPPHVLVRGPGPTPLNRFEEELELRARDMRRIHEENIMLAEQNVARSRQLAAMREELQVKSQAIPKIRAEKEAVVRDLIQKGLKLEAELRALEPVKSEIVQLKSEAKKLDSQCQELSTKTQTISQDLKRLQAENQQIPAMKHDVEALRQDVLRARSAFEYEKKAHAELLEHRQAMENNLISMAREVEKLKAEQRSLEKRGGGPGLGYYGALKPNSDVGYLGSSGDAYGSEKGLYGFGASSYDLRVPRH